MTLVVARTAETNIYIKSDTKITDTFGKGLVREQRERLPLAGLLKSVILSPKISVSFAGEALHAARFLKGYYLSKDTEWNLDQLLAELLKHHLCSENNCDFLLCSALAEIPEIFTIKDGALSAASANGWIGDIDAFNIFQKSYHAADENSVSDRMRTAFQEVIDNPRVDTVGHFQIEQSFYKKLSDPHSDIEGSFLYDEKAIAFGGFEPQHLKAGERTKLKFGTSETGAYSEVFLRSYSSSIYAVAIHFPHNDLGVLMCPMIDVDNPIIFHDCDVDQFMQQLRRLCAIPMEGIGFDKSGRLRKFRNF